MTHYISNIAAAHSSVVNAAVLGDEASARVSASQHTSVLRHLAAKMVYLAEQARRLGLNGLESTLVKTAAEVLTSAAEIANADYGPLLIQRLALKIDQIEDDLRAEIIDHSGAH